MNKHVIPLLKKNLEVIKWVLADKTWGREISDSDEFKTYRQLEESKKREYQKAIKILSVKKNARREEGEIKP